MDALAVVLPVLERRFDGQRRDALLCAHAMQMVRACPESVRARIFDVSRANVHDVLARLSAFRPSHVLVEHSPLAYGSGDAVALAAAVWARVQPLPVLLVSHPEYGRHSDALDATVSDGLLSAGPLVAQATRVLCHEKSWARTIATRLPSCERRVEVVGDWPVLAPRAVRPVDAGAPQLVLIDTLARPALLKVLAAIAARDGLYRIAMLYGGDAGYERLAAAIEQLNLGERVTPLAALTDEHLASAIAECSRVVVAESRYASESMQWARTANGFGRCVTILKRDGSAEQIERPIETGWAGTAHTMLFGESGRALAASLEEDVEEPTIGI